MYLSTFGWNCCKGLLLFGSLCSALNLDNVVLDKLRDMETRLVEQERQLAEQQSILVEQNIRLAEQEIRITEQEQVNANQQRLIDQQQRTMEKQQIRNNKLEDALEHLGKKVTVLDSDRCENCGEETVTNLTEHQQHIRDIKPSLRVSVRQQPEHVAFTAFLDHNVEHLGIDHPIVYNRVLLNEGSTYHSANGMFNCPLDGLYAFYFSVSTNGVHQAVAKLVVEGVNQVDAISDTYHQYHEAQGANFAIVSLTKGQQVWVANYRWTDKSIQDDNNSRFSTFSGFMLY